MISLRSALPRVRIFLAAAGSLLIAAPALHAQASLAAGGAHYSIVQGNNTLGEAQYTVTTIPGGYSISSTGHMRLAKFSYSFHNQATLDASLNLVRDALTGSVDGAKAHGSNIAVNTATDASGREFNIQVSAQGKDTTNTVDRHRNTVLVPDLDPGAYMLMARIAMAQPPTAWAVIPKENGLLVPAGYQGDADVRGTLNGAAIDVKHTSVALSDTNAVTLEIYASVDGQLLEADLNAQNLDVVRDGFKLLEHPAPTPPPPGEAPQQPGSTQVPPQQGGPQATPQS